LNLRPPSIEPAAGTAPFVFCSPELKTFHVKHFRQKLSK
jgi:hypothetical protein